MSLITDARHVAAVTALAEAGIDPDVQELLVAGNPRRGVAPGALAKALKAADAIQSRRPTANAEFWKNDAVDKAADIAVRYGEPHVAEEILRLKTDTFGKAVADTNRETPEALQILRSIPEGWQLVPKIATEEMRLAAHDGPLLAGEHVMNESNREWLGEMYVSMLEAAPSVETQTPTTDRSHVPIDGRMVKRHVEALRIEWSKQQNGYETTAPHPYFSATVYRPAGSQEWSYRVNGRIGRDGLESRDAAVAAAEETLRDRLQERLQDAAHLVATMFGDRG
jgi:hypothetical protein